MGVPSFFKWISAKYPLILQQVVDDDLNATSEASRVRIDQGTEAVPISNLYLDCNGIVHPCCHPEGSPAPKDEAEMFANVAALIDRLVATTRPSNVLYLALDGVAPRAKMNQQRTRRFCAAREAVEQEAARRKVGCSEAEKHWDHNVITPGTPFMARLAAFLRTYVAQNQVTGGPLWQKLAVIIDDSGSPGEGEHKIVDYIRNWRRSSDYSPDVVHAICGQDADLIMLGLSLHEPRVIILRDRASPPKKGKGKSGAEHDGKNEKGLDYLRIDRLRQYLLYEFGASLGQPGALPFPFDIEMVLNDFIFLCFLVGNDFLPHLPSLAIREGGLDLVLFLYKHMLPSLGGYITSDSGVDLARFGKIIARIGLVEYNIFRKRAIEARKFENYKREQEASSNGAPKPSAENHLGGESDSRDPGEELAKAAILAANEAVVAASGAEEVCLGKEGYKDRYYAHKLKEHDSTETRRDMVVEYTKGLLWVAHYYSQGVPSWEWYYPYHHAPFAADMVNLETVAPNFTLGKPITPLEQLMAVLPAASAHCVPAAYRPLMEAPHSPIADCYPRNFEMDPNGTPATLTWLWVARLPFIDAPRLSAALAEQAPYLTAEEQARNELCAAEVSVCEHHVVASEAVRKPAERNWVDIAGLALGGRVKAPVVLRSGGSGLAAIRYTYEPAPKGFHTSRLHPSFADVAEPLTWDQVVETVPKRQARLPLFDNEVEAMLNGKRPDGYGKGNGKGSDGGGRGDGKGNGKWSGGGGRGGGVTPPPAP